MIGLKSSSHVVYCFWVADTSDFPLLSPTASSWGCSRCAALKYHRSAPLVGNGVAEKHAHTDQGRAVLQDIWLLCRCKFSQAFKRQLGSAVRNPMHCGRVSSNVKDRTLTFITCSISWCSLSKPTQENFCFVTMFLALPSRFGFCIVLYTD